MESGAVCSQLERTPRLTKRRASASRASNAMRAIHPSLSNRELSTIAKNGSGCSKLEIIEIIKTGEFLRG
jgi:hypothetical protein